MAIDIPSASYMALYIISVHILHTNSRTSTHWKLNAASGMVEAVPLAAAGKSDGGAASTAESGASSDLVGPHGIYDPLMNILITSRVALRSNGEWRLEAEPPHCYEDCDQRIKGNVIEEKRSKTNRNSSSINNTTK